MSKWAFFTEEEVAGLDPELVSMLDMAHKVANEEMAKATGGKVAYVTFRLTATTGGKHTVGSAHYKGLAVDIGLGHLEEGFARNTMRWAIMKGLYAAGFQRIEDCPKHIHADIGKAPDFLVPTSWIGEDS